MTLIKGASIFLSVPVSVLEERTKNLKVLVRDKMSLFPRSSFLWFLTQFPSFICLFNNMQSVLANSEQSYKTLIRLP